MSVTALFTDGLYLNVLFAHFSIIRIVLKFSVKTVHLKGLTRDKPDCYLFNVMVGMFFIYYTHRL